MSQRSELYIHKSHKENSYRGGKREQRIGHTCLSIARSSSWSFSLLLMSAVSMADGFGDVLRPNKTHFHCKMDIKDRMNDEFRAQMK